MAFNPADLVQILPTTLTFSLSVSTGFVVIAACLILAAIWGRRR